MLTQGCEYYHCSPAAGLDLVALSETDSSLGDVTDSDAASVSSDDVPSCLPAWAHALVDQVFFFPVHHSAPLYQQTVGYQSMARASGSMPYLALLLQGRVSLVQMRCASFIGQDLLCWS